jgi:hypothetical protein
MKQKPEIKEGDVVRPAGHGKVVSTGTVELISGCGRYARVRERYGKKTWIRTYAVKDLKLLSKREQPE